MSVLVLTLGLVYAGATAGGRRQPVGRALHHLVLRPAGPAHVGRGRHRCAVLPGAAPADAGAAGRRHVGITGAGRRHRAGRRRHQSGAGAGTSACWAATASLCRGRPAGVLPQMPAAGACLRGASPCLCGTATLSYTGTGLLMLLFVHLCFDRASCYQHQFTYGETVRTRSPPYGMHRQPAPAAQEYGYTARTMAFPVMNLRNSLKNLAGVVGGLALLAGGARALAVQCHHAWPTSPAPFRPCGRRRSSALGSACPLLVRSTGAPLRLGLEAVRRPAAATTLPDTLPIQLLNSAILNLTLALPISSLMYRHQPARGRAVPQPMRCPFCAAMALVLLRRAAAAPSPAPLAGCGLPGAVLFVPGGGLLRAPGRRVKFSTRRIPPRKTPQGDLLF